MCRIDDDNMSEVHSASMHKARKQHRCYECRRDIMPGERYERVFSVYEGEVSNYKTCSHCLAGQQWLHQTCQGYIYGEVIEEIEEHAREYGMLALARFAVAARRKWQRFKSADLMPIPAPLPALTLKH